MDAQLIPQQQVSQEQIFVDYIFKSIGLIAKVEQDLKSKQLFIILLWLCRYYEDNNIFDLNADIEYDFSPHNITENLILIKYNSEARKIRLLLYRLRYKILETLFETSKKYLIQKYFRIFHRLYTNDVKLNVGDIIIYRKTNPTFTKNLCIIKNITDKNYVLETIYTNSKTFRKNLYNEEINIENKQLFNKIFMDKQQLRINKRTLIMEQIDKIYKNNEGVYCGRDKYQVCDFYEFMLKV